MHGCVKRVKGSRKKKKIIVDKKFLDMAFFFSSVEIKHCAKVAVWKCDTICDNVLDLEARRLVWTIYHTVSIAIFHTIRSMGWNAKEKNKRNSCHSVRFFFLLRVCCDEKILIRFYFAIVHIFHRHFVFFD